MSPPVCRYFLNGNCRFGDRCRFSHDVLDNSYGNSNYSSHNPYVLNRTPLQSTDRHSYNEPKPNWKPHMSYNDIKEIVDRIREEAKQVEYENLWPLTCLNVLKDASYVPGWEDYSMEELRVAAYSSKKAGRFDEYVRLYGTLLQKAKDARTIFLSPGKRAEEVVRGMFEKPSQSDTNQSSAANFSFAQVPALSGLNPSQTSSGSVFGGSAASGSFGTNPFGTAGGDPAPGLFAMAAQGFPSNTSQGSVLNDTDMETASDTLLSQSSATGVSPFQQNIFGQVIQSTRSSTDTAGSVFGGNPLTSNVFGDSRGKAGGGNTGNISIFGSAPANPNIFGGATPTAFGSGPASSSIFGGPPTSSNVFGSAPTAPSALGGAVTSSVFGSAPTPSSIFGNTAGSSARCAASNDDSIYTPIHLLNEEDLEQFKAATFTLSKLPLVPPPRELCE